MHSSVLVSPVGSLVVHSGRLVTNDLDTVEEPLSVGLQGHDPSTPQGLFLAREPVRASCGRQVPWAGQ